MSRGIWAGLIFSGLGRQDLPRGSLCDMNPPKKKWVVYILRCKNDTLYTGITTDVTRRVKEHNTSKRAAKYTSLRRPVELVFFKKCIDRSEAIKEELRIKKLTRIKKLEIISKTKSEPRKARPIAEKVLLHKNP